MQSNPNATLPKREVEYVAPDSQVVVYLPRVHRDHDQFVHEVVTVLADVLHNTPVDDEPVAGLYAWGEVSHSGGTILSTTASYPASLSLVNGALERVSERYGVHRVLWTFGPRVEVQA